MKGFKEPIEEYLKQMNKEMLTSMITKDINAVELQSVASLLETYQISAENLALIEEFDEIIALGKRQRCED